MAILQIQTQTGDTVPPYVQRTLLDGVTYQLGFRWVDRAQVWVMSIATDDGTVLVGSIAIRNNFPLTIAHKAIEGFPQGDFVAYAKTSPELDAGQSELGGRVVLYYQEAA